MIGDGDGDGDGMIGDGDGDGVIDDGWSSLSRSSSDGGFDGGLEGDSGILPLIFLKIGNMPLFANYIWACSCFDTRLP